MITIYTQPTCGQCRAIKMLLKQKGVEFDAVEDIQEMEKIGIKHTPTLKTPEGTLLVGKELMEWIRNYNL